MRIDPTTPVIIGVGQSGDRIDTPDYQAWSSIDLGAAATRNALADTGVAIAPGVDFDTVNGGSFVRLSFAGAASDITTALQRLGPWLRTSGTSADRH